MKIITGRDSSQEIAHSAAIGIYASYLYELIEGSGSLSQDQFFDIPS
jgi:hypothetical protein